jgi:hypothetical protein
MNQHPQPQTVAQVSLADIAKLKTLKRGEKPIATVKDEVLEKEEIRTIIHTHYEHQSVEIKVQTLGNFRKAVIPIFESVKNSILAGELDALRQLVEVRAFKKELEKIEEFLSKRALDEAQRLHKSELQNLGWEIGSTGDKYDYEQDQEYARLKYQLKEREEKLKRASKLGMFTDEATGEEIQPIQIKTFATEYLRTYNPPKAKD